MDETNFLHRTRNVYLNWISIRARGDPRIESQGFHAIFDSAGLRENITYLSLLLSHTQVSAPTGLIQGCVRVFDVRITPKSTRSTTRIHDGKEKNDLSRDQDDIWSNRIIESLDF